MSIGSLHAVSVFIAMTVFIGGINAQSQDAINVTATPLANAHAHNDYEHERPLLDALDQGFTSIEADVFLVEGQVAGGSQLLGCFEGTQSGGVIPATFAATCFGQRWANLQGRSDNHSAC